MKLGDDLCAHYLNLDFSENFLTDHDTKIHVQHPYPIHKPFKNTTDIINKWKDDVESYNDQLSTLSKEFQSVKGKIMNQSFSNSHATITKGLLNLCNSNKYETPFPCDYNPYYATGFLEHFKLNNADFLIRPNCKNYLCVTNIENPSKTHKLNLQNKFNDITGISIEGSKILLRHKNEINLIKISDINDVEMKCSKEFKLELLDAKLSDTQIGIVLKNSQFRLYDIETLQRIDFKDGGHSTTRFEFHNENVALLGQKKIKLVDLRSNDSRDFEPDSSDCNYLCAVKFCDNIVYLATRHHLIRTDVRFFKSVEFCTHLMKSSPCYMDLSDDFLCLSSQNAEDKVLFYGSPISSLPLNIPSVCDNLNRCKLQRDILLKSEVNDRLEKSVGGIKLIRDNNGTFLYSVNCLGDVFKQRISDDLDSDDSSVETFYNWVNKLSSISKPLHFTNVDNLSEARFTLNDRIKSKYLTQFTKKSTKARRFLNQFSSMYNKDTLSELATNFVSIWEEDEEEEREDVDLVPEVAPLDKVTSWIESNYFFD